ncbi:MAG: hypothetical protein U0931_37845 [Vulcanimicrobiota bacterium]
MIRRRAAILLLLTSLARAQDRATLAPMAGKWKLDGAQVQIELKADEMWLSMDTAGAHRVYHVPYVRAPGQVGSDFMGGWFESFKAGPTSLTFEVRSDIQGESVLSPGGKLETSSLHVFFRKPREGTAGYLQIHVFEQYNEAQSGRWRSADKEFKSLDSGAAPAATLRPQVPDRRNLAPLAGTWKDGDMQVRIEVKSDELRFYLEAGNGRREYRASFAAQPMELSASDYINASFYNFTDNDSELKMTLQSGSQGEPLLAPRGILERGQLDVSLRRDKPGELFFSLGESVRDGSLGRTQHLSKVWHPRH